jgi:hypothetical protein
MEVNADVGHGDALVNSNRIGLRSLSNEKLLFETQGAIRFESRATTNVVKTLC